MPAPFVSGLRPSAPRTRFARGARAPGLSLRPQVRGAGDGCGASFLLRPAAGGSGDPPPGGRKENQRCASTLSTSPSPPGAPSCRWSTASSATIEVDTKGCKLAQQLKDATNSFVLKLGEGAYSDPGTRRSRYQSSAGSAGEVRMGLYAAVGWRYLRQEEAEPALAHLDRLLASLWKLTH